MKKFALLSFLFIAIASTEVRFCKAAAAPDAVLDINGKNLRASTAYYILPVAQGTGGGLTIGSIQYGDRCPTNVVQELDVDADGLPIKFTPANSKKDVVRVSTDLNIEFETSTRCARSTVWKLGKFDQYLRQYFVTIGGTKGNPGRETVESWFKIEKYGKNYKFMYCPTSVCKYCKVMCKNIGIFFGRNGRRALVLSDAPFPVMFKKV